MKLGLHGGEENPKKHVRYSAQCFILFGFGQEFSFQSIPTHKAAVLSIGCAFFSSKLFPSTQLSVNMLAEVESNELHLLALL